jgi:hypothetical protein
MRDGRTRAWLAAVSVIGLAGLGACVEPDPPEPYVENGLTPVPRVVDLAIDSGGQVQLDPGSGVAVTVAYAEGGRWSVTTACDTLLSDSDCRFDIIASTDDDDPITAVDGVDLEGPDSVNAPDEFAVSAELFTSSETDGFGFATTPGATVRVSALLYDPSALLYDPSFAPGLAWRDDPRMISWVGDGAVHRGAPTNPVDLTPDRP